VVVQPFCCSNLLISGITVIWSDWRFVSSVSQPFPTLRLCTPGSCKREEDSPTARYAGRSRFLSTRDVWWQGTLKFRCQRYFFVTDHVLKRVRVDGSWWEAHNAYVSGDCFWLAAWLGSKTVCVSKCKYPFRGRVLLLVVYVGYWLFWSWEYSNVLYDDISIYGNSNLIYQNVMLCNRCAILAWVLVNAAMWR